MFFPTVRHPRRARAHSLSTQADRRARSPEANRHLAYVLTFVAGAVNAGGFLAVQQYTSHMSGIVSMMADHLAVGGLLVLQAWRRCPSWPARRLPHS